MVEFGQPRLCDHSRRAVPKKRSIFPFHRGVGEPPANAQRTRPTRVPGGRHRPARREPRVRLAIPTADGGVGRGPQPTRRTRCARGRAAPRARVAARDHVDRRATLPWRRFCLARNGAASRVRLRRLPWTTRGSDRRPADAHPLPSHARHRDDNDVGDRRFCNRPKPCGRQPEVATRESSAFTNGGSLTSPTDQAGHFCLCRIAAYTRSASTRAETCIRVATQLHRGSPRDAGCAESSPSPAIAFIFGAASKLAIASARGCRKLVPSAGFSPDCAVAAGR